MLCLVNLLIKKIFQDRYHVFDGCYLLFFTKAGFYLLQYYLLNSIQKKISVKNPLDCQQCSINAEASIVR